MCFIYAYETSLEAASDLKSNEIDFLLLIKSGHLLLLLLFIL